jgi:aminoacyl tRNA synthase complex-interacting multifunctional protein 1
MSTPSALSALPQPLRDLVTGAVQDSAKDFGSSEKDRAEVAEWIDNVAQGNIVNPENLKVRAFTRVCDAPADVRQDLDAKLTPRTYAVSNYLTAADVALYGALHPTFVRSTTWTLTLVVSR